MASAFQASAFQNSAFQIDGAQPPVVAPPEVGSSISGGTFSRGRWRKIQDEIERKARRALDAKRAKELLEQQAAEAAEAGRQRELILRRAREDEQSRQAAVDLLLQNALGIGPQPAQPMVGPDVLRAAVERIRMQEDEEDAIALLLLHQ